MASSSLTINSAFSEIASVFDTEPSVIVSQIRLLQTYLPVPNGSEDAGSLGATVKGELTWGLLDGTGSTVVTKCKIKCHLSSV